MREVYFVDKGVKVFQKLKSGGSVRCREMLSFLEGLGFIVKNRGNAGHKTFYHPKFSDFMGGFDCGHNEHFEIKQCYKRDILRMIEESEDLLSILNGGEDD